MRFKILAYMSFLLLPVSNFPFSRYGLGSDRPISAILFLILFLLNIDIILKKCINKSELKILGILIIAYLITAVLALFKYHGDLSGVVKEVNLLFAFIPAVECLILILKFGDEKEKNIIIRCIVIGYSVMFVIGLLQLCSVYLGLKTIDNFYKYLTGDIRWFLNEGRIQFILAEPSEFVSHYAFILLPLKRLISKENRKKFRIFLIAYGIMGIFTFSVTYYVGIIAYFIGRIFDKRKVTIKTIAAVVTIIIGFIILVIILNSHILRSTGNLFLVRVDTIYQHFVTGTLSMRTISGDMSFSTRMSLLSIGLRAFIENPILGYGFGYGIYGFRELIPVVNSHWSLNSELVHIYERSYVYLGGFYTNTIGCMGILGIVLLYFIFKPYIKAKIDISEKVVFLVIMLESNFLGMIPAIICWTTAIYYRRYYLSKNSFYKN